VVGGRDDANSLIEDSVPDLGAWWAQPGEPGWTPSSYLGIPFLPTLAGHVTGAWSERDPGAAPSALPWPGVPARRPIAWSDSAASALGLGSAWSGFDGSLGGVAAPRTQFDRRTAHGVFRFATGDLGVDQNSLAFERGDSLAWGRVEAAAGKRGAVGPLGLAGAHLWGAALGTTRGRHRFDAEFAQRGYGAELFERTEREAASGQSGSIGWRWNGGTRYVGARLERGFDGHQSYDDGSNFYLLYSRRDAQESRARLEAGQTLGRAALDARFEVADAEVRRLTPQGDPAFNLLDQSFDRRERAWWSALGATTPVADGVLRADLGLGYSRALDRTLLAPGLGFAFGDARLGGRVLAMRVVRPVWSDLFAGQAPFLQNTWGGGFELRGAGAAARRSWTASAGLLVGVTRDRAIWLRHPIQDLALRFGALPDPSRTGFALATSGVDWRRGAWGIGVSGFALGRDPSAAQAQVDPNVGARTHLDTRFALFKGDLGVHLRVESAWVGARQSEATSARLPGYATSSASAGFTLGDARIVLAARNLEDVAHEEGWLDPRTGAIAKGPRRDVSLAVTWLLFD
jgi:hypothetical protein